MKRVFADTSHWIALLSPKDSLHALACEVSKNLGPCQFVTSEMVLVELLNGLSKYGEATRKAAVELVRNLEGNPNVEIVPQTSYQFRSALDRYNSRLDKEWGATDCASIIIMEERSMSEALTHDHHFAQANFRALLQEKE